MSEVQLVPQSLSAYSKRSLFISHAVADRVLANALQTAIASAYSNLVDAYFSSDAGPSGGIRPGAEWFDDIHRRLRAAEQVWVLATKESVQRPWIYWEAGMGRGLCPGSVVVVRVGVETKEVPSPLNQLQIFNGASSGPQGFDDLLGKVAYSLGMQLHQSLLDAVTLEWLQVAKDYKPSVVQRESSTTLSPEEVRTIDSLIARLENASRPRAVRSVGQGKSSLAWAHFTLTDWLHHLGTITPLGYAVGSDGGSIRIAEGSQYVPGEILDELSHFERTLLPEAAQHIVDLWERSATRRGARREPDEGAN